MNHGEEAETLDDQRDLQPGFLIQQEEEREAGKSLEVSSEDLDLLGELLATHLRNDELIEMAALAGSPPYLTPPDQNFFARAIVQIAYDKLSLATVIREASCLNPILAVNIRTMLPSLEKLILSSDEQDRLAVFRYLKLNCSFEKLLILAERLEIDFYEETSLTFRLKNWLIASGPSHNVRCAILFNWCEANNVLDILALKIISHD
jgi:hypothetical protein